MNQKTTSGSAHQAKPVPLASVEAGRGVTTNDVISFSVKQGVSTATFFLA